MLQVKQKFYKSTTPIKFGVCLGLTLGLTACNLEKSDSTLTVYAPASLATVIDEVNHAYYQAYATKVQTSYASSGTLAKQIENNAPVDIFLSAPKIEEFEDPEGLAVTLNRTCSPYIQ